MDRLFRKVDFLVAALTILLLVLTGLFLYSISERNKPPIPTVVGEIATPESEFVQLEVVEEFNTYIVYRDQLTDVMYLEMTGDAKKGTSYHTCTVIYGKDGFPLKYSDYKQN